MLARLWVRWHCGAYMLVVLMACFQGHGPGGGGAAAVRMKPASLARSRSPGKGAKNTSEKVKELELIDLRKGRPDEVDEEEEELDMFGPQDHESIAKRVNRPLSVSDFEELVGAAMGPEETVVKKSHRLHILLAHPGLSCSDFVAAQTGAHSLIPGFYTFATTPPDDDALLSGIGMEGSRRMGEKVQEWLEGKKFRLHGTVSSTLRRTMHTGLMATSSFPVQVVPFLGDPRASQSAQDADFDKQQDTVRELQALMTGDQSWEVDYRWVNAWGDSGEATWENFLHLLNAQLLPEMIRDYEAARVDTENIVVLVVAHPDIMKRSLRYAGCATVMADNIQPNEVLHTSYTYSAYYPAADQTDITVRSTLQPAREACHQVWAGIAAPEVGANLTARRQACISDMGDSCVEATRKILESTAERTIVAQAQELAALEEERDRLAVLLAREAKIFSDGMHPKSRPSPQDGSFGLEPASMEQYLVTGSSPTGSPTLLDVPPELVATSASLPEPDYREVLKRLKAYWSSAQSIDEQLPGKHESLMALKDQKCLMRRSGEIVHPDPKTYLEKLSRPPALSKAARSYALERPDAPRSLEAALTNVPHERDVQAVLGMLNGKPNEPCRVSYQYTLTFIKTMHLQESTCGEFETTGGSTVALQCYNYAQKDGTRAQSIKEKGVCAVPNEKPCHLKRGLWTPGGKEICRKGTYCSKSGYCTK